MAGTNMNQYIITEEQPHKIYLAGSWKNQPEILLVRDILKSQGHEVDCFASEDNGRISFNWSKLDDIQDKLPSMDAKDMLEVKRVHEAFREDKKWLDWCDLCILILPSGKSAHLEAGYAKGQGKTVVIFGDLQKGDFDVMYGFADAIYRCDEIDSMVDFVSTIRSHPYNPQTEREKVLDEFDLLIPLCDAIINKLDPQSQLGFNALLLKRKYEELRQEGKVESPRCKYDMIPERCASVGHDGICYCSEHLDQCPHFKEGKVAK